MHKRNNGQYVITVTWPEDAEVEAIKEWIQKHGGSDSAAVKYAINEAMQKEQTNE